MKEILLCKYGEIVLKGANRKYFEDVLLKEFRFRASTFGHFKITRTQSVLYAEALDEEADFEGMFGAARRLFGLSMIDRAAVTGKTMEEIMACAKEYLPPFLSGKKRTEAVDKGGWL